MDLIDELRQNNIHIRDEIKVTEMLKELMEGGPDRLQVIADFDMTLSKFIHKGVRCDTCHNILDESPLLPEFFREKAVKYRKKYFAIETDPNMTVEEKYPYMVEWWTLGHELLIQSNVTKHKLEEMVRDSKAKLREGCDWFFEQLHKQEVPLLIFSAGLGDLIEEIIRQQAHLYSNMKIVSNYMEFDEEGVLIGWKGDLIHTFNKNESAIHKSDYFSRLRHRENVILLGDSIGDLRMAEGATDAKHILKIGFLNHKVEESLQLYKSKFDIVIVQDESLDIPNAIYRKIQNKRV
ncbi:cytosolic 5'-nucleotidase 3-like [Liolophura sinensis]|uniref:cytosolic 5'-nucleotidase 3-like n=1 Tax=Liolophura sinensis TaxID=3198878 RepID=UPI0031594E76